MGYQICTKTVMDTSDPSIKFDNNGVSNHFWDFETKVKPNWHIGPGGQSRLDRKIKEIKQLSNDKEFDCILGLSGGVDSSFMLHWLVTNYGLRPLVFHVDCGWNSEVAVHNIQALVDNLNVDLFTEVIDWQELKEFQLALFRSGVPHLDIPQDMAFISVLYKFAVEHNIKFILNGGNIATECVLMPVEYLYWPTDLRQVKDILRKHSDFVFKNYPFSSAFYHKLFLPYFRGINVVKPLNFIDYNKEQAIQELQTRYGWKPYEQKHFESRFTKFFEGYWLPTRFGYDMRRNQLSSLILTGQMKRDEALSHLEKPALQKEQVDLEVDYVAKKLGLSIDELIHFHRMPKKFYSDYKNNKQIFDFGERILSFLTGTRRGGAY